MKIQELRKNHCEKNQKKTKQKIFRKSPKTGFPAYSGIFGRKKIFLENRAPSYFGHCHFASSLCEKPEKTNEPIPRKAGNRRTNERTLGTTYSEWYASIFDGQNSIQTTSGEREREREKKFELKRQAMTEFMYVFFCDGDGKVLIWLDPNQLRTTVNQHFYRPRFCSPKCKYINSLWKGSWLYKIIFW